MTVTESREEKIKEILDTVRWLLDKYNFSIPWPTTHGKAIRRLKRLIDELDLGER